GSLKGNKEAIAETIENNVRSKIIKEHLNDPAFYEKMSRLLNEIISARKAKAMEYEEYLKQIAEFASWVQAGQEQDLAEPLKKSPALRALYNNLKDRPISGNLQDDEHPLYGEAHEPILRLAMHIDRTVKAVRPNGWRDHAPKESIIKRALFEILGDKSEV